jgi:hypothetical protein
MSRSGYSDDIDNDWQLIRWRGAVASGLRGKRGQAFLREMIAAFDALPEKRLIANNLQAPEGSVCSLGAVGKVRGLDMAALDPEDHPNVAHAFNVAHAMACEIMYLNDEGAFRETPEERFTRMRAWAVSQLIEWEEPSP